MSKITFSNEPSGYSAREVDTYIDMLEKEHIKAVDLISSQTAKILELENKLSEITIENSRLKEDSKRYDLEISKVYEERDSLKKQLEETANNKSIQSNVFDDKEALVEAILSLARANENLITQGSIKGRQEVYHSRSQVDEIVDTVLNENEGNTDTSGPKFSL